MIFVVVITWFKVTSVPLNFKLPFVGRDVIRIDSSASLLSTSLNANSLEEKVWLPSSFIVIVLFADVGELLITKALFEPKELAAPGVAKVSIALFPAESFIVPLFNANAVVDI